MTEKDLVSLCNRDFQNSGDCYGEETLTSINWDSLQSTDECDREEGCKVVAKISPSGTGYIWLCIKEEKLYTNWETKKATTLIKDDGSEYYKELYTLVQSHYPQVINHVTYTLPKYFGEQPAEVLLAIVNRKEGTTSFMLKNLRPSAIKNAHDWDVIGNNVPEIKIEVVSDSRYPRRLLKVFALKCKLEIKDSTEFGRAIATLTIYK